MVLGSLDVFPVGLAVARFPQELTHRAGTDRVTFSTQFLRKLLGALTTVLRVSPVARATMLTPPNPNS